MTACFVSSSISHKRTVNTRPVEADSFADGYRQAIINSTSPNKPNISCRRSEFNAGISMLNAFSPPPTIAAITHTIPALSNVVFIKPQLSPPNLLALVHTVNCYGQHPLLSDTQRKIHEVMC